MNDSVYDHLISLAHAGHWQAVMVAEDCSTYSPARFFDASNGDPDADPGPPPVRTKHHPDGLPLAQVPPQHRLELRRSNDRLRRTVNIALAANNSPSKATIVFENPADYSDPST